MEMPDQVTKHEFRHWLDAIDTNLAAAQHFEYPEVVLDKVRRFEGEIIQLNWGAIVAAANADIPKNKKIDECSAKEKPGDFMGGSDPWKIDITSEWNFANKSRYLYTLLMTKLNTDLHGKTIGIEGRNGLELYRQIVHSDDQILENAKFLICVDLSDMLHKYGDKVKD